MVAHGAAWTGQNCGFGLYRRGRGAYLERERRGMVPYALVAVTKVVALDLEVAGSNPVIHANPVSCLANFP
jgi:hypothetical protein